MYVVQLLFNFQTLVNFIIFGENELNI